MAFDASVIADIGGNTPDVTGSQAKALTLADLYDQNTLNKAKVAETKQSQSDMTYAKQILAGKDLSKLEDQNAAVAQITKRSPKLGMELMKGFQEQTAGKNELDLQQLKLHEAKNDIMGGAIEPLKAKHDQLLQQLQQQNPKATPQQLEQQVDQAMRQDMFGAIKNLVSQKLPNGQPVLNAEDAKFIQQNFANGYNPQAVDMIVARSKQAKEAIALKMKERDENRKDKAEVNTERRTDIADRRADALERQGDRRLDQAQVKLERTSSGGLTNKSAQMLAEQAAAGDTTALQGLKPADKVKVRNVMADNAEIAGTTGADQAAKNAEFGGIKAGQRTLGQRQANIDMAVQEAQNVEPILREASKTVPRGKFTSWNKLFQIADGEVSDPDLLAFAQAAKSFANIYTRATVPGASSVFDREEAVKHLPIYTSDESFQRVLDIMDKEMAAAKASPHQVRQDLSNSVTGSDRATLPTRPGQAGAAGAPSTVLRFDNQGNQIP